MDISSLSDYATLKKLASALWQEDNSYHGAAVMVGAGFSRSGASTGDVNEKLPLWNDFAKILKGELGSYNSDPLRLAEEYCAYFGNQALYDLIKKKINDVAWVPGELHKNLLELPWSEILTTNWDTLLERAAIKIHHPVYNVVSKQEDLSSARTPRIVKLHGTIDVTKDLVFTQEDYRKYPQDYAAFVNFARQVFIENELCLLGFSGDDPNFLQWAGWVRDHLAHHSRRIYLVGALNLNASKRKYLESINVAPIDLHDLVMDYDDHDIKHLEAIKIFIQTLKNLKPKKISEWNLTDIDSKNIIDIDYNRVHKDFNYVAKLLEKKLPFLVNDRLSYPGWIISPSTHRLQLQYQLTNPWPRPEALSEMIQSYKERLLYEIMWYNQIAFDTLEPWLIDELTIICDTSKPCSLQKKQQLEIALFLLKNTRWMDSSEIDLMVQSLIEILEKGDKYWPDISTEIAYHCAIVARDKFNYSDLEDNLKKITNNEPIWKLRKASLFVEIGLFTKSKELVSDAYKELLLQYRNNRNSIYIYSRLAWAHYLMNGVNISSFVNNDLPSDFNEHLCDPWEHIEDLNRKISNLLDKQQEKLIIEPQFEAGHYKSKDNTLSFSNGVHPLLLLDGISTTIGIPLYWQKVSFLSTSASKLAEAECIDSKDRFSLAIRSANSNESSILNKVFSRVQVACLTEDEVSFLVNHCKLAIDYWVKKLIEKSNDIEEFHFAIERLQVFIEVLARVSVRITPKDAEEIFKLAVFLGRKKEFQHQLLSEPIGHLIKFSLESIPKNDQYIILADALSFPLQSELETVYIGGIKKWCNPIIEHPGKRQIDAGLDDRINELINSIKPGSTLSASSLLRLIPLINNGFLYESELIKIKEKIWGKDSEYIELPDLGLLKYVLFKLPSQDIKVTESLIRTYLFDVKDSHIFNTDFLLDILNAAVVDGVNIRPNSNQAIKYFDKLVSWRPQESDSLRFIISNEKRKTELIGNVLARSIVPSLSSDLLNEENFDKLCFFYNELKTPHVLVALPYFAIKNEIFNVRVEQFIRQEFQTKDTESLAYASYALLEWRKLTNSPITEKLISRLIYLIGPQRMIGLPALIWTANQMYCKGYLSDNQIDFLKETLPLIFDSSAYESIQSFSKESISISFIRVSCVRLAKDILINSENHDPELKRILKEAKLDALPEVRFAELE